MLDALEIRIPRLTAKVAQLSGGQRQAIAIARAASLRAQGPDHGRADLGARRGRGRGGALALINRVKAKGVASC
jgi:simple sugar transport system ATP-binding protein